MDYQETLKVLQQGSSSQRKRKVWLDKQKRNVLSKIEKAEEVQQCVDQQLRWCAKIKQGIRNSKRTLVVRLWFAQMFQRKCVADFQNVVDLVAAFEQWLSSYEEIIQEKDLKKEEIENARILFFCKKMEKQKKALLVAAQKCTDLKERASLVFLALLLTTIILLFKESKEIPFDPTVFDAKNRYNPLNALFPFRM